MTCLLLYLIGVCVAYVGQYAWEECENKRHPDAPLYLFMALLWPMWLPGAVVVVIPLWLAFTKFLNPLGDYLGHKCRAYREGK